MIASGACEPTREELLSDRVDTFREAAGGAGTESGRTSRPIALMGFVVNLLL